MRSEVLNEEIQRLIDEQPEGWVHRLTELTMELSDALFDEQEASGWGF